MECKVGIESVRYLDVESGYLDVDLVVGPGWGYMAIGFERNFGYFVTDLIVAA